MITYHYKCNNCNYEFEVMQSIKDKPKKKCPECSLHKLERVLYSTMVIDMTPKTVGSLADKQTKKMGHFEREEKQYERQQEMLEAKKRSRQQLREKFPNAYIPDPNPNNKIDLPERVQKALKTGDQKTVEKYIYEG